MNSNVNTTMGAMEWALLVLLSVIWGGAFFFNAVAVQELPFLTIVFVRVAGGALILYLVMLVQRQFLPLGNGLWRDFLVMGFLNNVVPFCCFVWAQNYIGGGLAAIMNASTPIIAVVIAHFLTHDEKLSLLKFIGVVTGLFGVMVMIGSEAFTGDFSLQLWGQLACVLAALSYSLAGIYGRRFKGKGVSPMASATGQVTGSSLILLPLMLFIDQPWTLPVPSAETFGALFGIAALSTALAYLIYFRILASSGATNILLVTMLVPVSAILLGVLILDEVLLGRHLGGMVLIALGLSAVDGRLWKKVFTKPATAQGG